jgi:hypothetical protein
MARPLGSLNKRTLDLDTLIKDYGCNPIEFLTKVAEGKLRGNKTQGFLTIDHRVTAAKELAKYIFPQRKAVDNVHSFSKEDFNAASKEMAEVLQQADVSGFSFQLTQEQLKALADGAKEIVLENGLKVQVL